MRQVYPFNSLVRLHSLISPVSKRQWGRGLLGVTLKADFMYMQEHTGSWGGVGGWGGVGVWVGAGVGECGRGLVGGIGKS